ncbi:MAG: hypothetical protein PVG96_15845 [Desulfobacterales bacterium]|jgi:hypothetical protein
MEFNIIPDKEALSRCAWCQTRIYDDMEVFGFGAKLKPDVDLSEYETHCIQLDLVSAEKPVYMMVAAQDSEAKKEGKDCMFLVCSEECGKKLKDVLEKEISLGKMFNTVLFE